MVTFALLAAVSIVGALGVVVLRQPVHAALALVGTLLTLAVLFVTLQAQFLAAIQVIVYAGAIMVLFLFVIMLLNVEERQSEVRPHLRWLPYGVGLLAAAGLVIGSLADPRQAPDAAAASAALQGGNAGLIAEALFVEFMLAFQLVGVLLLTAMVGAVSLVQRPQPPVAGATAAEPRAGARREPTTEPRSRSPVEAGGR
jgi:NADH-quinone oxidoreductase subunit J